MAASPKPTPIDDQLHFLPRVELDRLQELKTKLERLRVSIEELKGNVAFHLAERENLSGHTPNPTPILRRSGWIGHDRASFEAERDLAAAESDLKRDIAEQKAAQQEWNELFPRLTKIARSYLRDKQLPFFKRADQIEAESQQLDDLEAACVEAGVYPGGDSADHICFGGLSFFRRAGTMSALEDNVRRYSGTSEYQKEKARKLAR